MSEPKESERLQNVEEIEVPLFIDGDETDALEVEMSDTAAAEQETTDLADTSREENIRYHFKAEPSQVPASLDINKSVIFPSAHSLVVDHQGKRDFEGQVTMSSEIAGVPGTKKVTWYRLYCKRRKITTSPNVTIRTKSFKFPKPGTYHQVVTTNFMGYGKTVEGKAFEVK